MQTSSSEGMESLCRRHPLRMRSTPGVDPGYFWGGGSRFLHIAMSTLPFTQNLLWRWLTLLATAIKGFEYSNAG